MIRWLARTWYRWRLSRAEIERRLIQNSADYLHGRITYREFDFWESVYKTDDRAAAMALAKVKEQHRD